jgi:hypothetical protein
VAQSAYTPKDLNAALTQLMGRRVNLGYMGSSVRPTLTGNANMSVKTGNIHFTRPMYDAFLGAPQKTPTLALALGILGHELGHFSTGGRSKGVPNATGGTDYPDPNEELKAADLWGRQNMVRIVQALGLDPRYARHVNKTFRDYRAKYGYEDS